MNLVGQRYGRLAVETFDGKRDNRYYWLCRCDCGASKVIRQDHLRNGRIQSCGCFIVETVVRRSLSHGEAGRQLKTPEYRSWAAAKNRCENPANHAFNRYGGRGIAMCQRWRESFDAFLSDMGRRPTPTHSIDRIDNDGNYEPGNCRWATKTQQSQNRGPRKAKTRIDIALQNMAA